MSGMVTVIGGGPAGMAAALFAAQAGAQVTLLERNEKLGKKLYITGKGRCNVTNTAENLLESIPHNASFLHSAFAFLDAEGLRALLDTWGCPTKVERGGRVFPVSEKASDVGRALERALRSAGVTVEFSCRVTGLQAFLEKGAVVLATGGASYPSTGSTGDGYAFASGLGHTVYTPRPSLVPLLTREDWPLRLAGLSLRNVRLTAMLGTKERFNELGEMLFTHFGISGPLVLSMSSLIIDDDLTKLSVSIDMKPGLTHEQLERRLLRDMEANPRKHFVSLLPGLVPASMAELLPGLCGVAPSKAANQITKEERRRIAGVLKAVPVTISGFRPLEEAIVTRGGVDVREVSAKTMMSKRRAGLFFAGEVLDVDAYTGGFNLQIAFSTGALAGKQAAAYAVKMA